MKETTLEIRSDTFVTCEEDTKMILDVYVENSLNLKLENKPNSDSLLIVNIYGEGTLDLNITVAEDSLLTYLWVNYSDGKLDIKEAFDLKQNSDLFASFVEFSNGDHKKITTFALNEQGSNVHSRSANIIENAMDWKMYAHHYDHHTTAQLDNYAVGLENSEFNMKVVGHIFQGRKKSETHQVTRVLNLSDHLQSSVAPELLIDENDVAASHACTMGQPNPEEIYYLQSRGLSKGEALKLLILGYLLIAVEDMEEDVKEHITDLIQKKIDQVWIA